MTGHSAGSSYEELLGEAVRLLTSAARLTRPVGSGSGQESAAQVDFAEFLTLAVAGAAANIGSIEGLLDGRPGSWEAAYVRDMLVSTVGEDATRLLDHRTEPLHVVVNVDDILNDLVGWKLYDEAEDELGRRYDAIGIPSVTYRPGEPESMAAYVEAVAALEPATDQQRAEAEALDALRDRLDALRQADCAAYGAAFEAQVRIAAHALLPDLPVPIEVHVEISWQNSQGSGEALYGPAARLWEEARLATPLPWSGIAPRDYPPGPIDDADRQAGHTPLARLEGRS